MTSSNENILTVNCLSIDREDITMSLCNWLLLPKLAKNISNGFIPEIKSGSHVCVSNVVKSSSNNPRRFLNRCVCVEIMIIRKIICVDFRNTSSYINMISWLESVFTSEIPPRPCLRCVLYKSLLTQGNSQSVYDIELSVSLEARLCRTCLYNGIAAQLCMSPWWPLL